ncbi:hypothetical protein DMENIID0001_011460 [Sergentomyia squamirostris]
MNREMKVVRTKKQQGGKMCSFRDRDKLECHIPSDESCRKNFLVAPVTTRGIQACPSISLSLCNTENAEFIHRGVQHIEGGWPRDVNKNDTEQTQRYRKKIERDEAFSRQVLNMARPMEHFIMQNNAVNIYENFFAGLEEMGAAGQCEARTVMVTKDPSGEKRTIKRVSWAPDAYPVVAAAYCHFSTKIAHTCSPESLIWDTRSPNEPQSVIKAWSPINCVAYNTKNYHLLIGGLLSGQVGQWDPRTGNQPVGLSVRETSHREWVTDVTWLVSKNNTEFFSGSSDGQVLTWDTRHLQAPIEEPLILDIEKTDEPQLVRALGVTFLEFEATIPTRFMVGTERGTIFGCNRKGKTPMEKLAYRYHAHNGPVFALERNPAVTKIFLSVGDWQAKVWSEECRESAIIWTKLHKVNLYCGAWSKTRFSLFFVGREDGVLDGWDLLLDHSEPVISIKLCDAPLMALAVHENGENIAVGALDGTLFVVRVSQFLVENAKNDKALFTEMLERETRRQKVIESKVKEMKLKNKAAREEEEREKSLKDDPSAQITIVPEDNLLFGSDSPMSETLENTERDFFTKIEEERERRRLEAEELAASLNKKCDLTNEARKIKFSGESATLTDLKSHQDKHQDDSTTHLM